MRDGAVFGLRALGGREEGEDPQRSDRQRTSPTRQERDERGEDPSAR